MIHHWLTIAWRTVRGEPVFAGISVLSLAIGCAGALLVGAYLREELTWDHWIPDSERIVRLDTIFSASGREPQAMGLAPGGMGYRLVDELAGTGIVTRVAGGGPLTARVGETEISIPSVAVDPNFLEVIALPLSEGDPSTALSDPSGVVISEATRAQLFGDGPALGRTLTVSGGGAMGPGGAAPPPSEVDVVVTGVLARAPRNTQFDFALLAQHGATFRQSASLDSFNNAFTWITGPTFIKADSAATARAWRTSLPPLAEDIFRRNAPPGPGGAEVRASFEVTPLHATHLSPRNGGLGPSGSVAQLQLFATVAAALLFVSAFNYVSLSLARVVRRTREVGLRKAMGAMRGDLVRQHLAESALLTTGALVLGFGLAELVRPSFVRASNVGMEASALHHPSFLTLALAGGAALAVLVAAYPAALLAGVRPASILQGRTGSSRTLGAAIFALVAVQFAAATALVTAVAVFYAQARFIADTPLGYEPENRYAIFGPIMISPRYPPPVEEANQTRLRRMRAALEGAPGVISVSGSSWPTATAIPATIDNMGARIVNPGESEDEAGKAIIDWVDLEYLETMGMQTIAGRGFDAGLGGDRIFVDNPAAKPAQLPAVITRNALGLVGARTPEEALGRRARAVLPFGMEAMEIEVVGVIEDFHTRSLKYRADPIVFLPNPGGAMMLVAQVDPNEREAAVAALEAAIAEVAPGDLFQVLDQELAVANLYEEERSWRRVVTGVAALAVLVASLGLYGLTAFSANRRRREVGVRKSLGADEGQVLRLMLARFVQPVTAGVIAGWAIAYYAMAQWLSGLAHHVPLTPVPFALAGAGALAVAAATALAHALSAARTSPAAVLRTE